jgi:hypothetical protein
VNKVKDLTYISTGREHQTLIKLYKSLGGRSKNYLRLYNSTLLDYALYPKCDKCMMSQHFSDRSLDGLE